MNQTSPEARVGSGVVGTNIVVTLNAGETSPWIPVSPSTVVTCAPSGSPTSVQGMKAQATWSPLSVALADNLNSTSNAQAFDWNPGLVQVPTASDTPLINANAVRFVAVGVGGTGEIAR